MLAAVFNLADDRRLRRRASNYQAVQKYRATKSPEKKWSHVLLIGMRRPENLCPKELLLEAAGWTQFSLLQDIRGSSTGSGSEAEAEMQEGVVNED